MVYFYYNIRQSEYYQDAFKSCNNSYNTGYSSSFSQFTFWIIFFIFDLNWVRFFLLYSPSVMVLFGITFGPKSITHTHKTTYFWRSKFLIAKKNVQKFISLCMCTFWNKFWNKSCSTWKALQNFMENSEVNSHYTCKYSTGI